MIVKKRFVNYKTEEERAKIKHIPIAVKFNKEEYEKLQLLLELLQLEEKSVGIKQSIDITLKVLLEQKSLVILSHVMNNYRRNKRKGIVTFDDTNYEKYINGNSK